LNSKVKQLFNFFLFFALAAILLYFAFNNVDYNVIVEGFRKANYFWVVLSLCVGLFAHFIRSLRWRLLIEPLGKKPSIKNTFGAVMIGYLANLAFPRLGEITKCGTLRKTENIPFEALIGTVIVERASDILLLIISLIGVFLIKIDFFGKFIVEKILTPLFNKAASFSYISLIVILAFFLFGVIILYLIKINLFGAKVKSKVKEMYFGIVDGLKSVYKMKKRMMFVFYSFLLWFLYWLMTWLLVFSTSPTSELTFIDGLFLMVVGSFGMVVPVQGGFGAFHIITAMGLGVYGISREDGLVFATISHESQTLLVVVLGVIFMAVLFFSRKKLIHQKEKN